MDTAGVRETYSSLGRLDWQSRHGPRKAGGTSQTKLGKEEIFFPPLNQDLE